jgi:hypothetical protein
MKMAQRRNVLALFLFFFVASFCFASITIYYKDGTKREVHKITFKGSMAELYLIDGTVINVPVEKLDLASSGIGAPVGTYGTSKVTGERKVTDQNVVVASPLRQTRLREEWERAEKSATVVSSIGPMQRGDTVKIVGETTRNSTPSQDDYYDETEFWYDQQSRGYRFKAKDLDHAYVIVYRNQDGSFGKRLLDAATFSRHFKIAQPAKAPTPMPEYPIIPDKKDPDIHETNPIMPSPSVSEPAEQIPEKSENVVPVQEPVQQKAETEDLAKSSRRRSWIAYSIFLAVLAVLGVGAWLVIVRTQRPYIDTSKFSRYEEDLREFEIAIWLKNGKTADQLMEICLKKFYQDSPSVLTVCNKMLKGTQKGMMIPFIAKQTGRSVQEAERIYDQIQNQIERIRNLIREVSNKTGIAPAKPAVELTQKTVPVVEQPRPIGKPKENVPAAPLQPPPHAPQSEPIASAGNSTSSVILNPAPAERSSSNHLIKPEEPMRTATDIPGYASSVLNQISFLSSPEDK